MALTLFDSHRSRTQQVLTDLASDGLARHPFLSFSRAALTFLAVLAMVLQGGLIHELIAEEIRNKVSSHKATKDTKKVIAATAKRNPSFVPFVPPWQNSSSGFSLRSPGFLCGKISSLCLLCGKKSSLFRVFVPLWLNSSHSKGRRSEKRLFAAGKNPQFDSPDLTITFGFDELGREKEVNDPRRGIVENSYDVDGRTTRISSAEGTINYEYDVATGRRTATFTAFTRTEYGFDQLGRLETVRMVKRNGQVISQPEVTTYTYTPVGTRESVTLPNGVKTLYDFDRLNRLTNLQNLSPAAGILSSYAYTVAANGQRTAVLERRLEEDGSLSRTDIAYKYDGLKRLTEEASVSTVSGRTFTDTYVMDLVGNRLQKQNVKPESVTTIDYHYNNNDQILEEKEISADGTAQTLYGFDDNGSNVSKVRTGTDPETNDYRYNLKNRLSGAQISRIEEAQQVNINTSYLYGQNGIRMKAESMTSLVGGPATNATRTFLIDPSNSTGYQQVLEERDATNNPVLTYGLGEDILSQATIGTMRYFVTDGQMSNRLLIDSAGQVTDRIDYDAYGNSLQIEALLSGAQLTNLLYTGEQFDSELQMYYLRARFYNPNLGVLNTLDSFPGIPIDPQSLHKYSYVTSNPINEFDPSGNLTIIGVLSAIATIAFLGTLSFYSIKAAIAYKGLESISKNLRILDDLGLDPLLVLQIRNLLIPVAINLVGQLLGASARFVQTIMEGYSLAAGGVLLLSSLLFEEEEGTFNTSDLTIARDSDEFISSDSVATEAGYAFQRTVKAVFKLGSSSQINSIVSKKVKYRVPDSINDTLKLIYEIKSRRELVYSAQIADFMLHAAQKGYKFVIYVEAQKLEKISSTMRSLENAGLLQILAY